MEMLTPREQIIEVATKLFVYTDGLQWDKLQKEVFTKDVFFDMSSLGGPKNLLPARQICEMWEEGFKGVDAVNHLAGNFLVDIEDDLAKVFAYATATHYKKSATQGNTREFVGTYDLHMVNTVAGWRIDSFAYHLKYAAGNVEWK